MSQTPTLVAQLPPDRAQHHRARPPSRRFRRAAASSSTIRSCPTTAMPGATGATIFRSLCTFRTTCASSAPTGNIFLTNIHRVYLGEVREPSLEDDDLRDYFLAPFGAEPVGKTTDSNTDLGEIVREIEELAVFNDEAHHIHDRGMAWFKSIQDIHHRLLQKDRRLALQVDVTATPRHDNGAIFVQTVSDYPLVEAIAPERRQASCSARRRQPREARASTRAPSSPRNTPIICSSASRNGARATPNTSSSARRPCCSSWWTTHATAMRSAPICKGSAPSLQERRPRHPHEEQRRDFRSLDRARARRNWSCLRKQSNEIDTWKSPLQGHRLRPDAQRRLGRAQRHRDRRTACLCRPRATSCPSKRSGAA